MIYGTRGSIPSSQELSNNPHPVSNQATSHIDKYLFLISCFKGFVITSHTFFQFIHMFAIFKNNFTTQLTQVRYNIVLLNILIGLDIFLQKPCLLLLLLTF